MKRIALLAAFGAAWLTASCAHSGASSPAVYGELVDAGCLQADDSGEQAIVDTYAQPGHPAWLDCLFAGGTVAGCGVPCP